MSTQHAFTANEKSDLVIGDPTMQMDRYQLQKKSWVWLWCLPWEDIIHCLCDLSELGDRVGLLDCHPATAPRFQLLFTSVYDHYYFHSHGAPPTVFLYLKRRWNPSKTPHYLHNSFGGWAEKGGSWVLEALPARIPPFTAKGGGCMFLFGAQQYKGIGWEFHLVGVMSTGETMREQAGEGVNAHQSKRLHPGDIEITRGFQKHRVRSLTSVHHARRASIPFIGITYNMVNQSLAPSRGTPLNLFKVTTPKIPWFSELEPAFLAFIFSPHRRPDFEVEQCFFCPFLTLIYRCIESSGSAFPPTSLHSAAFPHNFRIYCVIFSNQITAHFFEIGCGSDYLPLFPPHFFPRTCSPSVFPSHCPISPFWAKTWPYILVTPLKRHAWNCNLGIFASYILRCCTQWMVSKFVLNIKTCCFPQSSKDLVGSNKKSHSTFLSVFFTNKTGCTIWISMRNKNLLSFFYIPTVTIPISLCIFVQVQYFYDIS